jgi:2Fe-2S ferredoxin
METKTGMSGQKNPYIDDGDFEPTRQDYVLTVVDEAGKEHVIPIEHQKLPFDDHGLPGSILDICMGKHIELDHACGGVCACSTCHIHVLEGADSCNEAGEEEDDQLENAYDLRPNSRLGCQCVPNGTMNVKVRIPGWNRNLCREPHGPDS